jgi:hypothetical protein
MKPARYFQVEHCKPREPSYDNEQTWQAELWWRGHPFIWFGNSAWTAILSGARVLRRWEVSKLSRELMR